MRNEKTKQWLQLTFSFFFMLVLLYAISACSWFVMTHYGTELGIMALLIMLLIVAAFIASIFEN